MPAHGVPRFVSASHSNDSHAGAAEFDAVWFDAASSAAASAASRRFNDSGIISVAAAEALKLEASAEQMTALLWNGPFVSMLCWSIGAVVFLVLFGLLWFRRNNLYVLMPWSR